MKITNKNTYGKGVYLSANLKRGIFILLCFLTPMTNWLIPIITRKIKGSWIRY